MEQGAADAAVDYNEAISDIHLRKGSLLEYNGVCLAEGPWAGKAYFDAQGQWRCDPIPGADDLGGPHYLIDEAGDLLFVAVNVARFLGADPETALRRSNRKFERRFRYVEAKIKSQGRELKDASLAEMDALWEEAKALSRRTP